METYKRVHYDKAVVWINPKEVDTTKVEEHHAADFNAQFENSGVKYIKEGDEVPDYISSTPINLASQPKNEDNKMTKAVHSKEDANDTVNRQNDIDENVEAKGNLPEGETTAAPAADHGQANTDVKDGKASKK